MNHIDQQKKLVEAEIKKLEAMGGGITNRAKHLRDSALNRFPTIFVLLSSFGLVATFYGFEKVIDQIDLFSENPITVLAFGIVTLALTGTLYKKLS